MKTPIFIAIAAITLMVGADDPTSSSAVKARRQYEEKLRTAHKEHWATLKIAKGEYLKQVHEQQEESLKQLQKELGAALEGKDLTKANEINTAIEAMSENVDTHEAHSAIAAEAKEEHDEVVQVANEKYREFATESRQMYLTQLQGALDAALVAKDLKEANRIDATMKTVISTEVDNDLTRCVLKFMEVDGIGDSVVYLIDTSSSMDGNRLKLAQSQLKKSLRLLQAGQKFAIIFYNDDYRERLKLRRQAESERGLYFASELNKQLAAQEVDRVTADRGTDHRPAILEALSLKPDVIYFLTDGDEPALSTADLTEIAKRTGQTTIHVVKFGDGTLVSRKSSWLQRLAIQSQGEYREIKITN
jgi:hypothetical protein